MSRGLALALLGLAACAGCAPLPPPGMTPGPPVARADTATGRSAAGAATALADSAPSPAALEVLASIPEPLRPEERVPPAPEGSVPPPASSGTATDSPPPADPVGSAPEDSTSEVPIPNPTYPLGLEPPVAPDTTLDSTSIVIEPPPPPASPPAVGQAAPAAPPARASSDTCWRIQIGAPADRAKATSLQRAAESLLLIPMVIETEKRLHKVRTRDCWDRAAAERVRERAIASGFNGSFRTPRKP